MDRWLAFWKIPAARVALDSDGLSRVTNQGGRRGPKTLMDDFLKPTAHHYFGHGLNVRRQHAILFYHW